MKKSMMLTMGLILCWISLLTGATISGHVRGQNPSGNDYPVPSYVRLWKLQEGQRIEFRDTVTDEDGHYHFEPLPIGIYWVGAFPNDDNHIPQFYINSMTLQDATPIEIQSYQDDYFDIDFILRPLGSEGNATLSGTVYGEDDAPVDEADVYLISADYDYWLFFETMTLPDGSFSFENIEAGSYYLLVTHREYYPYYYQNAHEILEATPINLPENSSETVECHLTGVEFLTIGGSVSNVSTGQGIGDVLITFQRDHQHGNDPLAEFSVLSDQDGYWSINLPAARYRVHAGKPGFFDQYWDHKANFFNADWIRPNHDIPAIEFDLIPMPHYMGSISGQVLEGGEPPQYPCQVIAISSDEDEDWESQVSVNQYGNFDIPNVPNGSYYLLVTSQFTPPTWYNGAYTWESAQQVEVSDNAAFIDMDVQSVSDGGIISLSGGVYGLGREPLNNAFVIVLDQNDDPVGFSFSDNDGFYSVLDFTSGVYNIIATRLFYNTETRMTYLGNLSTMDFNLSYAGSDTPDPEDIPASGVSMSVSPNPFNPETVISFNLSESAPVSLSIYNVRGQKVKTLVDERLAAGTHYLTWNGKDETNDDCCSGVYFGRLEISGKTTVRSMTLLK